MYENFDGSSPDQTEGAQKVTSRVSVEPEDCVSFADHNECLKNKQIRSGNAKDLLLPAAGKILSVPQIPTSNDPNYLLSVSTHLNKSLVMTTAVKFNRGFCMPEMKPNTCVLITETYLGS